ncbi:MAG: multinuclear nonheme iron-dependent oxidase, partial [Burkholderiales bacterium]
IFVSASNHGFDPMRFLRAIPVTSVWEMHLAGFDSDGMALIDTHGKPVADAVWTLYAQAVRLFGAIPTLIEWDTDIPALDVLLAEAGKADGILEERDVLAA